MKRLLLSIVAVASLARVAAAQGFGPRIEGDASLFLSTSMSHALSSYGWTQYYNSLGYPQSLYMEGYHAIASTAGVAVDEYNYSVSTGYYGWQRQGVWEYGTCYNAAVNASAYPFGPPADRYGIHRDAFVSETRCAPEDPNAACNQSCWTTCRNGQCPPQQDIQECTPYCSPLVLDLVGFGLRTSGAEDPVLFDVDADGTMELMGWIAQASDDAFLWRDAEKNHRVDDGSELFGVGMTLPDGTRAQDGFVALAVYDAVANGGNDDGQIANADDVWRRLRLWRDVNHNGVSEKTEISRIQSSCAIAISLNWVPSSDVDLAGNQHRMVSTYRCRTGSGTEDRALVDVFFRVFDKP